MDVTGKLDFNNFDLTDPFCQDADGRGAPLGQRRINARDVGVRQPRSVQRDVFVLVFVAAGGEEREQEERE